MLNLITGYLMVAYISLSFLFLPVQKIVFKTNSGKVKFISSAPLETISARSQNLKGIIDTTKNTFAFSVAINSFEGFNSPLQQEHFYENYMESSEFPVATFSGKLIENIDYSRPVTYEVRAKGILNVHGVKSERIIRADLEILKNQISLKSKFSISLKEHNIKIPRIVYQKIAPDIDVEIQALLEPFQL